MFAGCPRVLPGRRLAAALLGLGLASMMVGWEAEAGVGFGLADAVRNRAKKLSEEAANDQLRDERQTAQCSYLPLTVGNVWVYDYEDTSVGMTGTNTGTAELTVSGTDASRQGGFTLQLVKKRANGSLLSSTTFAVSNYGGVVEVPAMWVWRTVISDMHSVSTFLLHGYQTDTGAVTGPEYRGTAMAVVPSGTYSCAHMYYTGETCTGFTCITRTIDDHYARDVGLISSSSG